VLYRQPDTATAELMRARLKYLAVADRRPGTDIQVRILPAAAPVPVIPGGGYAYLAYPEIAFLTAVPDVILIESLDGMYRHPVQFLAGHQPQLWQTPTEGPLALSLPRHAPGQRPGSGAGHSRRTSACRLGGRRPTG
jgi:hypothetical protein